MTLQQASTLAPLLPNCQILKSVILHYNFYYSNGPEKLKVLVDARLRACHKLEELLIEGWNGHKLIVDDEGANSISRFIVESKSLKRLSMIDCFQTEELIIASLHGLVEKERI
jgi:hypothetical protein